MAIRTAGQQQEVMRSFTGVVLYFALCIGAVLCDEKCDAVMKNMTAKYGYTAGSTDVTVSDFNVY